MTRPEMPTVPDGPRTVRVLDVSAWQLPSRFNYDAAAKLYAGAMVRACYGSKPDKHCAEHVRRFHEAGLGVGLYAFWRATINAVDQWHCFMAQADAVRYGPGDWCPACDVEDDGDSKVCPEWSGKAEVFVLSLEGQFGPCQIYCSRRDWVRLGSPEWVLQRPLWVPHWGVAEPRTPGDRPWTMHQTGAELVSEVYPHQLDQDVARLPLPVIQGKAAERERIEGWIAKTADDVRRSNRP